MSGETKNLHAIDRAVMDGKLLASAGKNIRALLAGAPSDHYSRALNELVAAGEWAELNDRFYKTLEFGTGGLRGRTIGKIVAVAERGGAALNERPEFPCVGTNAMNFYNVSRATQGLVAYVKEWHAREIVGSTRSTSLRAGSSRPTDRPKLVIAHDTRFFSKEFTELAAKVASE